MSINAGSLCSIIGERIEARVAWKFCKICKKKLSMYNNGSYCFIHNQEGVDKEMDVRDRKVAAQVKKTLKASTRRYYAKKGVTNGT